MSEFLASVSAIGWIIVILLPIGIIATLRRAKRLWRGQNDAIEYRQMHPGEDPPIMRMPDDRGPP